VSRIGGAAAFVVASTLGLLAFAEDKPNARLSWVRIAGAESCVDGDALKKSVAARLGRDPFAGAAPSERMDIEGTVAREPKRWIAKLWMRDEKGAPLGERELTSEADNCASLGEAVSLAIALAIDPDAPTTTTQPIQPGASATGYSSSAPLPVSTRLVRPPPATPPVTPPGTGTGTGTGTGAGTASPALFVRALFSSSLLPKPAPGLALAFEPVFSHTIRGTFGAAYFPPQRTVDRIASIAMTTLNGGLCIPTTGTFSIGVDLCTSLHAGATHAAVHRLEPDQPGDRFWFGASAGVRLRFVVAGLIIEAIADAWVPITRHRFRITGMEPEDSLFRQGPGLVGGIGLGWNRF